MDPPRSYERFPNWIVWLSILLTISIYSIGAYILVGFGIFLSIFYLLYCLGIEIGILRKSCVYCYYYGKVCGFGKGWVCSKTFKKGNPQQFVEKEITLVSILPEVMVFIFPLFGGIILIVGEFTWLLLALLGTLIVLFLGGNAIIRGSLACKYCKQKELGCPAEQVFR